MTRVGVLNSGHTAPQTCKDNAGRDWMSMGQSRGQSLRVLLSTANVTPTSLQVPGQ